MDAISESVFVDVESGDVAVDDPSLLTVVVDLSPQGWYNVRDQITLQDAMKSLLVFLNAHLALNNANQVALVASTPRGSRFLYPNPEKKYDFDSGAPSLVNKDMYRQFRLVDEAVLEEVNLVVEEEAKAMAAEKAAGKEDLPVVGSTLAGALSMVLTYTNRMLNLDQTISTTKDSAISSSTNAAALGRLAAGGGGSSGGSAGSGSGSGSGGTGAVSHLTSMKSRVMVLTASDDNDVNYILTMNAIFAAQKMRLLIDVAKLGHRHSAYLQQAADTTNGIYLHIEHPQGLVQVLATAFFIEPSIRPLIILPTNANTNYKASCFITGKSVDMGYVCSVCLCIMSVIPADTKCPTCDSEFDQATVAQLRRGPVVAPRKKRKTDSGGTATPVPMDVATPE